MIQLQSYTLLLLYYYLLLYYIVLPNGYHLNIVYIVFIIVCNINNISRTEFTTKPRQVIDMHNVLPSNYHFSRSHSSYYKNKIEQSLRGDRLLLEVYNN